MNSKGEKYLEIFFLLTCFSIHIYFVSLSINRSLWLDELLTSHHVQRGNWFENLTYFWTTSTQFPFYYLILKFLTSFTGYSEIALRLPSLLLNLFNIFLIGLVTFELSKNKLSQQISRLVLTLSPFSVYYSLEARPYSLAVTLTLLSCLFFLRSKTNNDAIKYFIISCISLLYTHIFGIITVSTYLLLDLIRNKKLCKSYLYIFSSYLPILPIILRISQTKDAYTWIPPLSFNKILVTLNSFTVQNTYITIFVISSFSIFIFRQVKNKNQNITNIYGLLIFSFTPLIFCFICELFLHPVFMTRYMFQSFLGLIITGSIIINFRLYKLFYIFSFVFYILVVIYKPNSYTKYELTKDYLNWKESYLILNKALKNNDLYYIGKEDFTHNAQRHYILKDIKLINDKEFLKLANENFVSKRIWVPKFKSFKNNELDRIIERLKKIAPPKEIIKSRDIKFYLFDFNK